MHRWRLVLPIAWMAVIWGLSSLPSSGDGDIAGFVIPAVLQNGAHVFVYGALAAAWAYALGPDVMTPRRAIMYCTAYGIVDELHQSFVPGRTSSVLDVLADVVGAVTVVYFISRYVQYRTRLNTSPG